MGFPEMAGQVAVVTGAAGGIGQAVATRLAEEGAAVALVDRAEERLRLLAKDLGNENRLAEVFPADLRSSAEVESVIGQVEDRLGPIAYLVNGAGVLRTGDVRTFTDEDWAFIFDVNASGVFYASRAVANRMVPRGRGAVVTVASNSAGTARKDMAAYAASKAATTAFTKCLGLELAPHGIRCNVVAPGSTDTDMLSSLWTDRDQLRSSIDGVAEAFRLGIPLGRVASPADVADAVLFLLSDQASQITMHHLTVDGGATLGT